jgi:uncharacterized RDD family membrane protein YckC
MSDETPSRMKTSLIQLKEIMGPKKGTRRGASAKISKVIDYKAKKGDFESRAKSFIVDIILIVLLANFLIYRNAHMHFGIELGPISPKMFIYLYLYVGFNIIPLRLFGQTGGMIVFKIKLLNKDYSYPSFFKLLQRETIGILMNSTVGVMKILNQKIMLTDEMFNTEVIKVERKNNKKES